ncbi:DUF503 family protein [Tundrisphaera sp. TA3]|uniref:DUF503 family protein n=1 Tax=Tundrisphaera sp. TA3 TaxID=3435775 RepID=UPI003EB6F06B
MLIASLRITVRIAPGFRSKKKTTRVIVEKIHRHFNVSVIELGNPDHPSESVIGVAALGLGRREIRSVLDRVLDAVASHPRAEVVSIDRDDH